jgi:hypothetical protein
VVVASAIGEHRKCFVPNSIIHAFVLLLHLLSLTSTMSSSNEAVKSEAK